MILKEKRDGAGKGRSCTDSQKQQEGSQKKDATSPTLALESVLIISEVDMHERRDVSVVKIPWVFLTTDMDKDVIMVLQGILAELMVKTKPRIYQDNL